MRRGVITAVLLSAALAWAGEPAPTVPAPARRPVDYAREVLPILSDACFHCHGFDPKTRKAGLRLDTSAGALKTLRSGAAAVVPGDPKASELMVRIRLEGEGRMPPAKHTRQLTDAERDVLQRWIAEGAEYRKHWSFEPPVRPAVPAVADKAVRTAVDAFLLARLRSEGLSFSPEADRYALARRLSLDLTGLPPSIEAADRFAADPRPDAYERYVDSLLASPAFGERWAAVWLDLARYADSNGYAEDQPRRIWRYRDWVIDALNRNQPFDRFTVEQIAGDLLPAPTTDQLLATAFHRNTLTNTEGGTNDEEFRTIAIVDRVNTTFQVWMGLSMQCAQCHDHKYDPLRQEEYFGIYAIFNQTEDADRGDNSPYIPTPTAEMAARRPELIAGIRAAEDRLLAPAGDLDEARLDWEDGLPKKLPKNFPKDAAAALKVPAAKRTAGQARTLDLAFRATLPRYKADADRLASLRKELADIDAVTTPIMRELPAGRRRKTQVHIRGDWLNPGKEVAPHVPAMLPPLPAGRSADRMALAEWLVAPENPLTARVAVNRFWEQIFGLGLVETPEEFGTRGKPPTHPELLDWLAVEFRETGWDVKRLLRLMVTSAAYRQAARVTPELVARDPENRLLARGPRFRISAETVRDQALYVSGLLSPKIGGPSVRPLRPKFGLSAAFGPGTDWDPSPGEDRRRRALYTEWRRSAPYPSATTFDAPGRSVCTVSRPRTNTPLQALVTLNDPVFVEAAQSLGRRMVREGGSTTAERVRYGFRLCLTRPPTDAEAARLADLFDKARAEFASKPAEAAKLATDPVGPLPAGADPADAAAWTLVANVLLNLDEMFAKR